jgi:hypothetical protein
MFANQKLETASAKQAINVSYYEKANYSIDRSYCASADLVQ